MIGYFQVFPGISRPAGRLVAMAHKIKAKRRVKTWKREVELLRQGNDVNYREESKLTLRIVATGIR